MAERSGAKLPAGLPCPTSHAFCIMRLSRRTFIKALGCELLAGARCPIARKRHLAGQSFKNRQHVWVRIALPGHRSSLVTGRRAEYLRACAPAGQTRSTGIAKSRAGIPEVPCRIKAWRSAERSGANGPQKVSSIPQSAPCKCLQGALYFHRVSLIRRGGESSLLSSDERTQKARGFEPQSISSGQKRYARQPAGV